MHIFDIMLRFLHLPLLFFLASVISRGQSNPCYFLKDIGGSGTETSNSAVELSDGTIYVTGSVSNGPYGLNDIPLLKFDACGNLLWTKYYGDSLANDAFYINKTYDDKLLIIGQTGTTTNGSDIVFFELDSSGAVLMQRFYGDSLDQNARYIEQTKNKGFIFCGYTSDPFGSNDSYVVRTDSLGVKQWDLVVGGPSVEYADMVHELPDSNFVMSGDTKSYGAGATDFELVKIHRNGNIIWDKYYGDHLNNGCQGVYLMSNGNYVSYGETEVPNSVAFDFFIQMIDTSGNSISRHTFGGSGADALFGLTETPQTEFMCTGYSRSFNGFQAYDVVFFKVDTAGTMKWLKNIYSPGIDIGYKIIPSLFGDYVITGLFDDNNGNYFLTRTDTVANTNVSVNEPLSTETIRLYPNPASDFLRLEGQQAGSILKVFNALGEKVLERRINGKEASIDIANFASGVYTIFIQVNGKPPVTKKLQIVH